jgi:hypothetical protein
MDNVQKRNICGNTYSSRGALNQFPKCDICYPLPLAVLNVFIASSVELIAENVN